MSGVTESSPSNHPEEGHVPVRKAEEPPKPEAIETQEEHDRRVEELRRLLDEMEKGGKLDI